MGSIPPPSYDHDIDILIIGGGLSGCYALHSFRKLAPKPTIKLIEAAGDLGGVWYHNRYPGARVDSEWPLYQLSIPEVWEEWGYKDRFPDHNQIRAYIKHLDDVLDLKRDSIFNTIVDKIVWDDSRKKWDTETQDGKTFTSRFVIVCTGSSYKRHLPDFKGLGSFRGTLLHSASFPAGKVDMTGKRVGVIGAGATGVQIVQDLAKQNCQLINFIRTPNNALPMRQRKITPEEEKKRKLDYETIFRSIRNTTGGWTIPPNEVAFKDATQEQKDEIMKKGWEAGGFAFYSASFREMFVDKEVNSYYYNYWAERVRTRISDPEKREIMAPISQKNLFGMKRPSLEQDYYECIDQPNVKLVDLKKTPISEVTEHGVLTEDGKLHELDVLILATGYDAMTGSQKDLGIIDKNGVSLEDKWAKGTVTYLGLMIPGCPNMMMSYGPQGPTALGNAPPIIETAVDWMVDAIKKMHAEGIETIDPRLEAASNWNKLVQDITNMTLIAQENSWWMGSNIPGKPREALNYFGGLNNYALEINSSLDGWKGFDIEKKASET